MLFAFVRIRFRIVFPVISVILCVSLFFSARLFFIVVVVYFICWSFPFYTLFYFSTFMVLHF